jgi:tetratricopeptide (TPR) repeat protein
MTPLQVSRSAAPRRPLPWPAWLALLALLGGCAKSSPPPHAAASGPLRSQALIDSGNAAFRAKAYDDAARRYASAVAVQPDDPAAYYGLGMALSRLGRDDEARVAYAKARDLAARAGDSTLAPPH